MFCEAMVVGSVHLLRRDGCNWEGLVMFRVGGIPMVMHI